MCCIFYRDAMFRRGRDRAMSDKGKDKGRVIDDATTERVFLGLIAYQYD